MSLNHRFKRFCQRKTLEKNLEVYHYDKKIRLGPEKDGGYVICDLVGEYDCYISCGVGNEASFDRDFLSKYNYITKNNSFAFDGTVKEYPSNSSKNITFIKKNINIYNDDKNTNLLDIIQKYNNIFLSIDIEGCEYPWILSLSENILKRFKQICIEFHGVSESYDKDKINCFKKLNNTHYILHAHENNHCKIINGIPNVLELTYVNKNYFKEPPIKNKIPLPINGLDFPNNHKKHISDLPYYPFTYKNFEHIYIGDSKTNTKIVVLDKIYDKNTKLYFTHKYKDKFKYEFNGYNLKISRTDKPSGWKQKLKGFL